MDKTNLLIGAGLIGAFLFFNSSSSAQTTTMSGGGGFSGLPDTSGMGMDVKKSSQDTTPSVFNITLPSDTISLPSGTSSNSTTSGGSSGASLTAQKKTGQTMSLSQPQAQAQLYQQLGIKNNQPVTDILNNAKKSTPAPVTLTPPQQIATGVIGFFNRIGRIF